MTDFNKLSAQDGLIEVQRYVISEWKAMYHAQSELAKSWRSLYFDQLIKEEGCPEKLPVN